MDKPSEASAFLAVILALLGVSDLTAASINEEASLQYWLAVVPVRLMFLFAVTGYVYLFKEDGLLGSGSATRASIGEPLQNSMVFAFGFLEIAAWFWVSRIYIMSRSAIELTPSRYSIIFVMKDVGWRSGKSSI